jgi:hypothetical protein
MSNAVLGISWAMGWKVWAEVNSLKQRLGVWVNDRFGAERERSEAPNSGKVTSAFA